MKRFFKVFLPLTAIVLVLQALGVFVYRWTEGKESQGILSFIIILLILFVPMSFLTHVVGRKKSPNSAIPLLICFFFGVYVVFNSPRHLLWCLLFLGNLAAIAIASFLAIQERRNVEEIIIQEEAKLRKDAMALLHRFKTSINRQYFVISNVEAKDILFEMEDEDFLYQLPDGRYLVIMKPIRKASEFEDMLDFFRDEAKEDMDVLGYIDNEGKPLCQMIVSDSVRNHQSFTKGSMGYIPFDIYLLEEAQPIVTADYLRGSD